MNFPLKMPCSVPACAYTAVPGHEMCWAHAQGKNPIMSLFELAERNARLAARGEPLIDSTGERITVKKILEEQKDSK